jgi:hypothetical protein
MAEQEPSIGLTPFGVGNDMAFLCPLAEMICAFMRLVSRYGALGKGGPRVRLSNLIDTRGLLAFCMCRRQRLAF